MLRRFAWVLILLIASSCGGFESFSAEELETTKGKSLKRLAMTCPTFLISTSDVSSSDLYMMNDQNLSVPQP